MNMQLVTNAGVEPIRVADAMEPIQFAYSGLIEHTGDLMDLAIHGEMTAEHTAIVLHLAQAMSERCLVLREIAEHRLERLSHV